MLCLSGPLLVAYLVLCMRRALRCFRDLRCFHCGIFDVSKEPKCSSNEQRFALAKFGNNFKNAMFSCSNNEIKNSRSKHS